MQINYVDTSGKHITEQIEVPAMPVPGDVVWDGNQKKAYLVSHTVWPMYARPQVVLQEMPQSHDMFNTP